MSPPLINKLIKNLIDFSIFLEFTDEKILDQDVAVGILEQISSELQELDSSDQIILAQEIINLSDKYPSELREFIMALPDNMGLINNQDN